MKKTANVQLNQWDPEDRILRTDFNADNEKIDAAIGGIQAAMRVVKLLDVTTELAATQIDLDVSGIDLTAYQELWLYLRYGIDTEVGYIQMRLNGINEGYTSSSSSYSHCYSVNLDNQRGIKKSRWSWVRGSMWNTWRLLRPARCRPLIYWASRRRGIT